MPPFEATTDHASTVPARQSHSAEILVLSAKLAPVTGRAFLEAFSRAAAEICGAEHMFVGRLNIYSNMMRTLCLYDNGEIVDNITYNLLGTPCAHAVDSDTCIYNGDVASRFPLDTLLAEMRIAGYVGTPLRTEDGKPLGIIVALAEKPFDDPGKVTAIFDHFRDRIAREVETLDALERFGLAADNGAIGLWDWDLQTGDMFVTRAVSRMLGYEEEERSYDLSLIDHAIHEEDREIKKQAFTRHMNDGSPFDVIVRLRTRNGVFRWFRLQASAVRNEQGMAVRMVGTVHDVHELIIRGPAPR